MRAFCILAATLVTCRGRDAPVVLRTAFDPAGEVDFPSTGTGLPAPMLLTGPSFCLYTAPSLTSSAHGGVAQLVRAAES